jgi:hypothetical protein
MATIQESQQNRLQVFANVFKGYMGVMPIATAALAPLLTAMNVLPVYDSQRKPLATMAGVLGFLLLAWLFYVRRTVALGGISKKFRQFFNLCPLLLVLGSIACYVSYTEALDASVGKVLADNQAAKLNRTTVLGQWSLENSAPISTALQLYYLGMFLSAEAAFILMALREYANDVRQISEYEWMFGLQAGTGGIKPEVAPVSAPEPKVTAVGN